MQAFLAYLPEDRTNSKITMTWNVGRRRGAGVHLHSLSKTQEIRLNSCPYIHVGLPTIDVYTHVFQEITCMVHLCLTAVSMDTVGQYWTQPGKFTGVALLFGYFPVNLVAFF